MKSVPFRFLAAVSVLAAVGCVDNTSPTSSGTPATIANAFLTVPVGFDATANTFGASSAGETGMFIPPGPHDRGGPGMPSGLAGPMGGMHGPGLLMGGGLGPDFLGLIGAFRGFGHGPFGGRPLDSGCAYSSATGVVTCGPDTHSGLTITSTYAFKTAAGVSQSAPDTTTDSVNEQVMVSGTQVRFDGDSSTVDHTSTRTTTGLARGSTQRTVNGTSAGTEHTTGTSWQGTAFSATRTVGDTVTDLVVPVQDNHPTFPSSGTVIRSMSAVLTVGSDTKNTSRREVITYNGSNNVTIVITQDGVTKTCTLTLPHGEASCS